MPESLTIRPAHPDELEALLAMQQRSLRQLGAPWYPRDVLEAALAQMGTMDPRLIGDGTYLVAELDGRMAGSAGWTLRAPNYARLLRTPLPELPGRLGRIGIVRSVYVDPDFARRGIGRKLMTAVEEQLVAAGVQTAELMATLAGVPLYQMLGYAAVSDHVLQLAEGLEFTVRRMLHPLPPGYLAAWSVPSHRGAAARPGRAAAMPG